MYTYGLVLTPIAILWITQVLLGLQKTGKTHRSLPSKNNGGLLILVSTAGFGVGLFLEFSNSIPLELFDRPMAGFIRNPDILILVRLLLNPFISLGTAWTVSNVNNLIRTYQLDAEGQMAFVNEVSVEMHRGRKGRRSYYVHYRYLEEWRGKQQISHGQFLRLSSMLEYVGSEQTAKNCVVLFLPGQAHVHRFLETTSLSGDLHSRYVALLLPKEDG
jgi:hypothetical protein